MDRRYLNRKSKFKNLSQEELKTSIANDLANESTDEEFVKCKKDQEKLDNFFGEELLNCGSDQEWIPDQVPSSKNDSDPTPISNNNDLELIDPTPDPTSSENETDINLNNKRKRKYFRKRKSKVAKMNTGFILETESGQASEESDFLFDLDLQDGPSPSKVIQMEIDKNSKKVPVAPKIDNLVPRKLEKRKKLKKRKNSSKNHNAAQKKTKKIVNPLVDRITKSIDDLINSPSPSPSTSQTKENTSNNKSIQNDLDLSIPETDIFEDNSNPNQFENQTVQNENEKNSARERKTIHKSTPNNLSSTKPDNCDNVSQENPDQIEVISVESPEKSQSENQTRNWKKLLTQAREKTTISKSNQGKPTKKSNVGKKTRKIIPLDLKLSIIQMHEDGGSNTKIARDKG
jgi:hypothetical protein